MITNERQFKITTAAAERFRNAIREAEDSPAAGDARKRKLLIAGMRGQLQTLDQQLAAYQRLKASGNRDFDAPIDDLGTAIVMARTARGWTQKQLAERLGVDEQQIQRYEANEYAQANLVRIQDVLRVLGATTECRLRLIDLPDLSEFKTRKKRPAPAGQA